MTLYQIRYFLSIASGESFTSTAERFHISQPAVSNQIAQLEDELQVTLFFRSRQGVSLTPAGQLFQDYFQRYMDEFETVSQQALILERKSQRTIYIALQSNIGWDILADVVKEFHTTYPSAKLDIEFSNDLERLFSGLYQELYDIIIVFQDSPPEPPLEIGLFQTPLILLASPTLPTVETAPSRLTDFRHDTFFVPSGRQRQIFVHCIEDAFSKENLPLPQIVDSTDMESVLIQVLSRRGVTLIADVARPFFQGRFFELKTDYQHYIVAKTTDRPLKSKYVPIFWDLLQKYYQAQGAKAGMLPAKQNTC